MWRKLFQRSRAEAPPAAPVDYTRTLTALVTEDDPEERLSLARLLGAQIQQAMGRLADNTQVAVWQVEEQWRALMQEQFGMTNEMIAANAAALEVAKAERAALRAEVHAVSERLMTANNESIAERRELRASLAAVREDLHEVRDQARQLGSEVALFIPPDQIRALARRVAELERRERGADE